MGTADGTVGDRSTGTRGTGTDLGTRPGYGYGPGYGPRTERGPRRRARVEDLEEYLGDLEEEVAAVRTELEEMKGRSTAP